MKKQITKGKATAVDYPHCKAIEVTLENGQEHTMFTDQFCYATKYDGDAQANAELIAEAFNVTNESGYTPAELLAQRNELLDALQLAKSKIDLLILPLDRMNNKTYQTIIKAINNATK